MVSYRASVRANRTMGDDGTDGGTANTRLDIGFVDDDVAAF